MCRDGQGRCSRNTHRLVNVDLAAHGTALVSCATGGVVLESVILLAAASHHVASIGFRLLTQENEGAQIRSRAGDALFSALQLILWTCCLLLALCVMALGAHGIFHADPLDAIAMAGFALPGAVAAVTTCALASWSARTNAGSGKADALLSGVPTVLALCVAFSELGANAGRVDALAGLALVLMLCVRTLAHLGRAHD